MGKRFRWFRDMRVSRKLSLAITVHMVHAIVLLILTAYALKGLSASRAYVEGEGLWSKAQKDATRHLLAYAENGQHESWRQFWEEINVTLGDRQARLEMDKKDGSTALMREGFLAGRNHPDDVNDMIWLYRNFGWEPHLNAAIQIWRDADALVDNVLVAADAIHDERQAPNPNATRLMALREDVARIDSQLTVLENEFSRTLGDGARWLTNTVTVLTVALTLAFVGGALLVSVVVARSVSKSLERVRRGVMQISEGEMQTRIEVLANDDLGQVSTMFNSMADRLERMMGQSNQRTALLEAAKAQAEAASQSKARFLATMSHEIRTPMNAVIGWAELLEKTPITPEQKEMLATIRASGNHLLSVINDILDFSKLEAGRLELAEEDVDLAALMEDAANMVAPQATARGVDIVCICSAEAPTAVRSDGNRIRQVIVNLLSNAIKFSPPGHVVIRGRLVSATPGVGVYEIQVSDSGPGVAPEMVPRLFQAFSQADDSLTREHGGTGLGLAISQSLARKLGGDLTYQHGSPGAIFTFTFAATIRGWPSLPLSEGQIQGRHVVWVGMDALQEESLRSTLAEHGIQLQHEPGPCALALLAHDNPDAPRLAPTLRKAGARIVAVVPLGVPAPEWCDHELHPPIHAGKVLQFLHPEVTAATPPESTLKKYRILVAEDNATNRKVVEKMLAHLSQEATLVADGQQALDAVARQTFDVAFVDLHMPILDGLSVAKRLASQATRPHLIALTADAMLGDRENALAHGFDDYLTKPVRIADLQAALGRVTKHAPESDASA